MRKEDEVKIARIWRIDSKLKLKDVNILVFGLF